MNITFEYCHRTYFSFSFVSYFYSISIWILSTAACIPWAEHFIFHVRIHRNRKWEYFLAFWYKRTPQTSRQTKGYRIECNLMWVYWDACGFECGFCFAFCFIAFAGKRWTYWIWRYQIKYEGGVCMIDWGRSYLSADFSCSNDYYFMGRQTFQDRLKSLYFLVDRKL